MRYVYFIRPKGHLGPVKIGCSEIPKGRLASHTTWSPLPLELVVTTPGDLDLEQNLHDCLGASRLHGEWFSPSPAVLGLIEGLLSGRPIEECIDLSDRSAGRRRKRKTSLRSGLIGRVHKATRRAERALGGIRFIPDDLHRLLFDWRSNAPMPDGLIEACEAYIASPETLSVPPKIWEAA